MNGSFVSGMYLVTLVDSNNNIVESFEQYLTAPIYRSIIARATLRAANGENIVAVNITPCGD